jgi:signal transduction histidine kinase
MPLLRRSAGAFRTIAADRGVTLEVSCDDDIAAPLEPDDVHGADNARSRPEGGSGLGLAIVLAVAREHGGTASAANRPEGGAIVSFHLSADRADGRI